ncbi:MAG: hypothetical protein H0W06_10155 [Chloroflexia bacterium]|nr:hypothetical protein [Chloroflexia bacterium]
MCRLFTLVSMLILALTAPSAVLPGAARQSDFEILETEAADQAIELSRLETNGEYGTLYDQMHLDSQAIIPPQVVSGWYADEFAPRQPDVITAVTDVQIIPWTWTLNDKSYPETAEITFEQPFGDEIVTDTIHLVKERGMWRWFYGVSLDSVNTVIERYAPEYPPVTGDPATATVTDDGSIPWGLDTVTTAALTPELLAAALPDEFAGNTLRAEPGAEPVEERPYAFATQSVTYRYTETDDPTMTSAGINLSELPAEMSVSGALEEVRSGPTSTITDGDLLVENVTVQDIGATVLFMLVIQSGGDVVGDVPFLIWGAADGESLYTASARDIAHLRVLAEAIADNVLADSGAIRA